MQNKYKIGEINIDVTRSKDRWADSSIRLKFSGPDALLAPQDGESSTADMLVEIAEEALREKGLEIQHREQRGDNSGKTADDHHTILHEHVDPHNNGGVVIIAEKGRYEDKFDSAAMCTIVGAAFTPLGHALDKIYSNSEPPLDTQAAIAETARLVEEVHREVEITHDLPAAENELAAEGEPQTTVLWSRPDQKKAFELIFRSMRHDPFKTGERGHVETELSQTWLGNMTSMGRITAIQNIIHPHLDNMGTGGEQMLAKYLDEQLVMLAMAR